MMGKWLMVPALALLVSGCERNAAAGLPGFDARACVKTERAVRRTFADRLRVQGTVRVRNSAVVSARVPGTIDDVFADEGMNVTNGAALFRVDRVNLENALAQARAARAAAAAVVGEAEAALEKATWDDGRMARLCDGGAVTRDAFEKARLGRRTATARLGAAKAQLEKADAAVKSAEKNLADSVVRAPFAGVVARKHRDAGDYVAPGVPVFALDDPSVRELAVSLAAAHYPKVSVGETCLLARVGEVTNRLVVSYKAPRVDPRTRTFEIRGELDPDGAAPGRSACVPGMIVDADVVFGTCEAQAVRESSVGVRGGRTVVFAVREGRVASIPVETGVRADGWIEVTSPDLADEEIVSEGMLLLDEGEEVRRVSE